MKTIMFDGNSVHKENGEIYLSEDEAIYFKLEDGMSIEVYEDNDIWCATVHKFTSSNGTDMWYVKLGEKKENLSDEQYKWEKIGFDNGYCLGCALEQKGIIQQMLNMGFDLETIDKIVNMSAETRSKCKKIIDER